MGLWMEAMWKFAALFVFAILVLLVAAVDLLHPLLTQQERDFPGSWAGSRLRLGAAGCLLNRPALQKF